MYSSLFARAAIAALIFLPGDVHADAFDDCRTPGRAEQRLAHCSAVIAGKTFTPQQKAYAYRLRGSARLDAGALEQAQNDLSEAIRLEPTDATTWQLRGQARVGRNDVRGAIADFTEAIRLNPRTTGALTGRGHSFMINNQVNLAIADFTLAIELSPKSATGHNNRGLAYRRAGNLQAAIDDYTAAINLNPIYALAYNNRGYAYEGRGDRMEAIADYRQALLLDPSLAGARQGLERLKALGPLEQESGRMISEGKALVEQHCSRCHAVGSQGESANVKAPPFRTLHRRHPVMALREPLTRGITAPHDEMPKFALADAEIDRIVAFINSLAPRR